MDVKQQKCKIKLTHNPGYIFFSLRARIQGIQKINILTIVILRISSKIVSYMNLINALLTSENHCNLLLLLLFKRWGREKRYQG